MLAKLERQIYTTNSAQSTHTHTESIWFPLSLDKVTLTLRVIDYLRVGLENIGTLGYDPISQQKQVRTSRYAVYKYADSNVIFSTIPEQSRYLQI